MTGGLTNNENIVSVAHRGPNRVLFATELLLMCWYAQKKEKWQIAITLIQQSANKLIT